MWVWYWVSHGFCNRLKPDLASGKHGFLNRFFRPQNARPNRHREAKTYRLFVTGLAGLKCSACGGGKVKFLLGCGCIGGPPPLDTPAGPKMDEFPRRRKALHSLKVVLCEPRWNARTRKGCFSKHEPPPTRQSQKRSGCGTMFLFLLLTTCLRRGVRYRELTDVPANSLCTQA